MGWPSSPFDTTVRLEIKVLVVGGSDNCVDPSPRETVQVTPRVHVVLIQWIESSVVAFDSYQRCDLRSPRTHQLIAGFSHIIPG
jgi:hypothetical protein